MNSLYNTPPTYSIYMMGLVFKWLKRNGGIQGTYSIISYLLTLRVVVLYLLDTSVRFFWLNSLLYNSEKWI